MAPSSLFLHRSLRTRLDLLRPNQESHVTQKQSQQKATHDKKAKFREFHVGQTVMARNLQVGDDWVPATIIERTGPVSYLVETTEHQLWKRHIDQLKALADSAVEGQGHTYTDPPSDADFDVPRPAPVVPTTPDGSIDSDPPEPELQDTFNLPPPPDPGNSSTSRYPQRIRAEPEYYGFGNREASS